MAELVNEKSNDLLAVNVAGLNFKYGTITINLYADDLLLLYTDGINETMNNRGEQFGEGRLIEILLNNKNLPTQQLINSIISKLNKFTSDSNLSDDKTLMILKMKKVKDLTACS